MALPSEEITPEIFAHLVHLAELELDPGEAEYLRRQLNGQLRAIHEMAAIEVDPATPITSHGVPYPAEARPALRDDVARPSAEADAILNQAPETEARYIVVPDIPHTDLA
jgi:aspartyl/glutamyl-tRNA(Asn/Gln) amidotransferase C subunit